MTKFITPIGEIAIIILGHASLLIQWEGRNIFVDPYSKVADYSVQPKADLILLTHHHSDHLDKEALKKITKENTLYVTSIIAQKEINGAKGLKQGEVYDYNGLKIEAVYAYNINQKRDNGQPFHPKGEGNGYILNFGGYRVYIAGDTELIPEMNELGNIDIAFLPKNLPYTMSDEMFIEAAKVIKPKILYPYHYSKLDEAAIKSKLPEGVTLYTK
ncbi:MAG: MBL fold metallo-hydrolase [Bacteroidales bacterium]|jgi:L-ascorbate metabolism protein UlaG (beta-lactamase superfamily)